ncbi:MAG: ABC transporter substrate-binding protein [Chloroflexi bacterium]|nr:ABC transporter substrate-binding protein [Chloroflexota bacterium]
MARQITRRQWLQILGGGVTGALLAACAGAEAPSTKPSAGSSSSGAASGKPAATQPAAAKPATDKPAADKPAAATSAAAKPAQQASASQGALSGTFWFNQPIQQEAFQKVIDRFHEKQSRVKMEVVLVPAADVPAKLATAIAGGEPPDAVRLGGPAVNALFIDKGHAAALDDWDPKISTYDWVPTIQKALTRNGKMYAMPVNSGVQALIYNKDVYKKAGLDPEKPPTTLAQLLEVAGKIHTSDDQLWGHYIPTAPIAQTGADYFPTILWAFGGKETSEDGTKITFNTPEGVAALQWYKDLVDRKGMPVKQINEAQMLNDYLTGNVGSMNAYPALVARVAGADFKSGSATLPAGPKSQKAPIGFGSIMVLDKGKNRDAGWEFAKFIGLDASNDVFWCIGFGQLPPRLSFRDDPAWKEYEQKNSLVPAYVEAQKSTDLSYFGPGAQEIGTELGKAIEAVVFGQKTPQQAIEDAAKTSQTVLDRERQKAG